jgi:hypothetical protein
LVGKEKNTLTCLSTKEKTRQANWNYSKKTKEDAHIRIEVMKPNIEMKSSKRNKTANSPT